MTQEELTAAWDELTSRQRDAVTGLCVMGFEKVESVDYSFNTAVLKSPAENPRWWKASDKPLAPGHDAPKFTDPASGAMWEVDKVMQEKGFQLEMERKGDIWRIYIYPNSGLLERILCVRKRPNPADALCLAACLTEPEKMQKAIEEVRG